MNSYASLCDDFGVSTYLHGKLDMPTGRETVLHFFEAVQKAFPKMTDFEKRSDEEYLLEEDRDAGSYRWASLDKRRLCSGFVNPPSIEDADAHNERILEIAPYHLDLLGDADRVDGRAVLLRLPLPGEPRRGGGRGAGQRHPVGGAGPDAGGRASCTSSRR